MTIGGDAARPVLPRRRRTAPTTPGSTAGSGAATSATSTPTGTSGSSAGRRRSSSGAATTWCPARWRPPCSSTRPWPRQPWRASRTRSWARTWRRGWCSATPTSTEDAARLPPGAIGRLQGAPPDYRGRRAPAQRERQGHQVPPRVWSRTGVTASFTTLTVEEIGRVRRLTLNRPDHHNPADAPLHPRAPPGGLRNAEARRRGERHHHPQHRAVLLVGLRLHRRGHRSRATSPATRRSKATCPPCWPWATGGRGSGTAPCP